MYLVKKEESSFLDKLQKLDPRLIWLLTLIVIAAPILKPLGLPLIITEPTRGVFNAIEKLKPGDFVIFGVDYMAIGEPENFPATKALMAHVFSRPGVKIILVAMWFGDGAMFAQKALDQIDKGGKEYGKDYVNLGYIPGAETAAAGLVQNIRNVVSVDYYGNQVSQLPLINEYKGVSDIKLWVSCGAGTIEDKLFRVVATPYGTRFVCFFAGVHVPEYMVYWEAGYMDGYINGGRGGAEYELISGRPGLAIMGMDAISLTHILAIILIILTNVIYSIRTFRKVK